MGGGIVCFNSLGVGFLSDRSELPVANTAGASAMGVFSEHVGSFLGGGGGIFGEGGESDHFAGGNKGGTEGSNFGLE